jgi:hygromycin-B 7''-O-kinase
MDEAVEYSKRLGRIFDEQFAAATARLGVGTFIRATPVTSGLFGQNVFLSTSEGEFVLRGAPHWVDFGREGPWKHERNDRWQFTKEIIFANLLHERTDAPVPWPQLLDEKSDVFGWPYIIMPRMPGICFDERSIRKALSAEQRLAVARALGDELARQQTLAWPFAGDVDATLTLQPYPGGHAAHVARETARCAANARMNGTLSKEDDAWIARIAETALAQSTVGRANVYVHGDYKLGNLCVAERDGEWRVSGIFDLHESRFGDGASDLCRQMCSYMDTDENLTSAFVESYRAQCEPGEAIEARFPLYLINDRIKFWDYFTRPDIDAPFFKGKTFRSWAGRYIERALPLLRR